MVKSGRYKTCPICGKFFYVIPAQEKRGSGTVCSRTCKGKLQSTQESKKKGMVYVHLHRADVRECRTCGREFKAINDHNGKLGGQRKRTPQVYCSHTCYVKGNRISKFEDSVFEYLVGINGNLQRQVRKGKWSFDMAIERTNVLIEADGSYWHSRPNTAERDQRKNDWCRKNGYELFRIDELTFYKDKETACQVIVDRMLKLDPSLEIKRNGEVWNG